MELNNHQKQYYIAVEEVAEDSQGGVEVKGVFSKALINRKDTLYVFGIDGYKGDTEVSSVIFNIEHFEQSGYAEVTIRLADVTLDDIHVGDVITNVHDKEDSSYNNIRLKALLYTMKFQTPLQTQCILEILNGMPVILSGNIKRMNEGVSAEEPLGEGDSLLINTVTTSNETYIPLYTSMDEQIPNKDGTFDPAFIVDFEQYSDMIKASDNYAGIVFNPYSDSITMTKEELEALKELSSFHQQIKMEKDTEVEIGNHQVKPEALIEALQHGGLKDLRIKKMWLQLMKRDDEYSHLLVVDYVGDKDDIFPSLIKDVVDRGLLNEMYLDVIGYEEKFIQEVVDEETPIYVKEVLYN